MKEYDRPARALLHRHILEDIPRLAAGDVVVELAVLERMFRLPRVLNRAPSVQDEVQHPADDVAVLGGRADQSVVDAVQVHVVPTEIPASVRRDENKALEPVFGNVEGVVHHVRDAAVPVLAAAAVRQLVLVYVALVRLAPNMDGLLRHKRRAFVEVRPVVQQGHRSTIVDEHDAGVRLAGVADEAEMLPPFHRVVFEEDDPARVSVQHLDQLVGAEDARIGPPVEAILCVNFQDTLLENSVLELLHQPSVCVCGIHRGEDAHDFPLTFRVPHSLSPADRSKKRSHTTTLLRRYWEMLVEPRGL